MHSHIFIEGGHYRIRTYLSFNQHKNFEIARNPNTTIVHNSIPNFVLKTLDQLSPNHFEMDQPQTYTRSILDIGWMRGTLVCNQ